MASAYLDQGLALAPLKRIYREFRDMTLLADGLFPLPDRQLDPMPPEHEGARGGDILPLPNRERFEAAIAAWTQDSLFDSLPVRMKRHASFQAIVSEGNKAVPLIAAELRREPSFLFLALEEITGENPVPDEANGDLSATVAAWLAWLRS